MVTTATTSLKESSAAWVAALASVQEALEQKQQAAGTVNSNADEEHQEEGDGYEERASLRVSVLACCLIDQPLELTTNFSVLRSSRTPSPPDVRSLLRRLQQVETTVRNLERASSEIAVQRETTVAATHQQLRTNQELLQQVRNSSWVFFGRCA